ncbi:glycoside hydrolase family 3 C-terminal domain-containing protein [Novosphingobium sp. G106]|uniref:glycoside hydrolase family 3 C-terminal domain-containing protein n=1 Tax=Novosphingobium sp. G106 TaxID=2849500 RepID=UPI001C2DE319|nr:glycoside hydrolase family 3 C-terminal domain-containing protein [Novosphingobium sp. G106]MBV1687939.1 glycoside hydrolase family 3 C-terminal domain-containing protein [Novosphingobium sp. G106]
MDYRSRWSAYVLSIEDQKQVSWGKAMGRFSKRLAAGLLAGLMLVSSPVAAEERPPYLDPAQALETRLDDLFARLTLPEKISLLSTTAAPIERLKIPAFNGFNQSLHGVVWTRPTTTFPVPIAMAATWNPALVHEASSIIADEARAINNLWPTIAGEDRPSLLGMRVTVTAKGETYGHNGLLYRSPVINLARDPRWGRIWEGFGEDPWLMSRMTVAYVKGMQGDDPRYLKIGGTLKHFPLNDEERDRSSISVSVSDRVLHEYYLRPFKAGVVEAGVASVMSSYNAINGVPGAANSAMMIDLLRKDWGFTGIAVPDSGAVENLVRRFGAYPDMVHAAADAIRQGTDLDTGSFAFYADEALKQGLLSEREVNQALRRIMRVRFRLGEFDPPAMVPYKSISPSIIDSPAHRQVALRVAREAIVLLRNESDLLPLDRGRINTIAVIGPMAAQITRGAQYTGISSDFPSNLDGIRRKLGSSAQVIYARGSGVMETDNAEASLREAEAAARKADVAIVFAGTNDKIERETLDRTGLTLPPVQGELIRRVRAANPRTVLVLQNGGPISLAATQIEYLTGYTFPGEKSAEAPAILDMFWAGEEGANAVADVLFGDYNPAGRMPYTVYRSDTFLRPMNDRDITKGTTYLYYEGTPEYAFGHGLSYSRFAYDKLAVMPNRLPQGQLVVHAQVQNVGKRAGDEVVQVYVRALSSASVKLPKRQLVGFQRVPLTPGEKRRLSFTVDPKDLAFWDGQAKAWVLEPGRYEVMVGSSSSDTRLRSEFKIVMRGQWSDGSDSPAPTSRQDSGNLSSSIGE